MKRLASALLSDVRYQYRSGFYFIYLFLIVCFAAILRLLPETWRQTALIAALLSDPALLGFFFIGGMLQLERGEGILDALFSTPLQPWEYIVSKAVSLGLIATLAGCLIALGSGIPGVQYFLLVPVLFLGSACFTLIGICVSVNLRSMNAFLSVNGLWEAILLVPPVVLLFNIAFAPLEFLPGSIALRLVQASVGLPVLLPWYIAGMALWTAIAFMLARERLSASLRMLGGRTK